MTHLSQSNSFHHFSKPGFPGSLWLRLWGSVSVERLNPLACSWQAPFLLKQTVPRDPSGSKTGRLPLWVTDDTPRPRNVKWLTQGHTAARTCQSWDSKSLLCTGLSHAPLSPRGRDQLLRLVQHSHLGEGHPQQHTVLTYLCGQFWVTWTCKSTFKLYCFVHSCRNECPTSDLLTGRWGDQWGQSLRQSWAKNQQKRLWRQCCHLVRHVLAHLRDWTGLILGFSSWIILTS